MAEWLSEQNADHVLMNEDLSRKGPVYALSHAGVQSTVTLGKTLKAAIEEALLNTR